MPLDRDDIVFCSPPLADRPLLDLLGPVRDAGFTAISVAPPQLMALQAQGLGPAAVRTRIVEAGLAVAEFDAITSWWPGQTPPPGMDRTFAELLMQMTPDRLVPLAAEVGARSISAVDIFGGPLDVEAASQAFGDICDLAGAHGLLVHLEFLPAGAIRDLATAAEIIRRADRPNGGLTLDTLHFFRGGASLEALRQISPERVLTVQLSDAPAEAPADLAAEMMGGREVPGDGGLDLVGVVRTLDAIGARAPIGVEVFNAAAARQPAEITARDWMAGVRAVLQAARADVGESPL